MKFDQGLWRLLPGIESVYPIAIADVRLEQGVLVVTGYGRPIELCWSYLNGAVITVRFTGLLRRSPT